MGEIMRQLETMMIAFLCALFIGLSCTPEQSDTKTVPQCFNEGEKSLLECCDVAEDEVGLGDYYKTLADKALCGCLTQGQTQAECCMVLEHELCQYVGDTEAESETNTPTTDAATTSLQGTTTDDYCYPGEEGCECHNNQCLGDYLVCQDGICQPPPTTTTSDTTADSESSVGYTEGDTEDDSGSDTGRTTDGTTGEEPCVEVQCETFFESESCASAPPGNLTGEDFLEILFHYMDESVFDCYIPWDQLYSDRAQRARFLKLITDYKTFPSDELICYKQAQPIYNKANNYDQQQPVIVLEHGEESPTVVKPSTEISPLTSYRFCVDQADAITSLTVLNDVVGQLNDAMPTDGVVLVALTYYDSDSMQEVTTAFDGSIINGSATFNDLNIYGNNVKVSIGGVTGNELGTVFRLGFAETDMNHPGGPYPYYMITD